MISFGLVWFGLGYAKAGNSLIPAMVAPALSNLYLIYFAGGGGGAKGEERTVIHPLHILGATLRQFFFSRTL